MISLIPGKIVFKCINILIQGVCTGRILRTDIDRRIVRPAVIATVNLHVRSLISHLTLIPDCRNACTELVIQDIAQMRVPLGHKRVRLIFHPVTASVKKVGRARRAENIIV